MKIKKVLYAPCYRLVVGYRGHLRQPLLSRAKTWVRSWFGPPMHAYHAELLFWADLPILLGTENVFMLGELWPQLHDPVVPKHCPWPSFHPSPPWTSISDDEVDDVLEQVDVVLLSPVVDKARREPVVRTRVINAARRHGVPIAVLDALDHEDSYAAVDYEATVVRGLRRGRDFDVYFKKDLLVGHSTDSIFPLAPMPIRPESYRFNVMPKDIDIFYSGRPRSLSQPDRGETVALVKGSFPRAHVMEHEGFTTLISNQQYHDLFARSRIALCPSGRGWDSWRFGIAGLAPHTAVVAPKPYCETVGPALKDGVNAILYEVEFRDGKSYLKDCLGLRERIAYYLDRPAELVRMADAWAADVRVGHTILARSRYVIERLESAL